MSDPKPATPVGPWPYVVAFCVGLVVLLIAFAILVFAPGAQVDHAVSKITTAVTIIASDPRGAAASVLALAGFAFSVWAGVKALLHTPPPGTTPPSAPVRVPPSSSTSGFANVQLLAFIVFGSLFALAGCAILLPGCNQQTQVQVQATAVEVAATFVETIANVVAVAADADVRATCPDGSDPTCTDAVAARWAPVDAAVASARVALQAWLAADRIAARANEDPIAAAADEIATFVAAYDSLHDPFERVGIDVPRLPAAVCAVAGVPIESCEPTSGGES